MSSRTPWAQAWQSLRWPGPDRRPQAWWDPPSLAVTGSAAVVAEQPWCAGSVATSQQSVARGACLVQGAGRATALAAVAQVPSALKRCFSHTKASREGREGPQVGLRTGAFPGRSGPPAEGDGTAGRAETGCPEREAVPWGDWLATGPRNGTPTALWASPGHCPTRRLLDGIKQTAGVSKGEIDAICSASRFAGPAEIGPLFRPATRARGLTVGGCAGATGL